MSRSCTLLLLLAASCRSVPDPDLLPDAHEPGTDCGDGAVWYARASEETDRAIDGEIDERFDWVWSADGLLVEAWWDTDADGAPNKGYGFLYDDEDRVAYRWSDDRLDRPGNDSEETYEYDAAGRLVRWTNYDLRWEPGTRALTYEWDGDLLVRLETDWGLDGVDAVEEQDYDGNGLLSEWRRDFDGDGGWEYVTTYLRDEDGNVLFEQTNTDCARFTYDEGGRELSKRQDASCDGTYELVEEQTYDLAGALVERTTDEQGDGLWDEVERWERDDAGFVTRYERDEGDDGTLERVEVHEPDAAGNDTWYGWDDEPDVEGFSGEESHVWQYDAQGRVTSHAEDSRNDGTTEFVHTFEYISGDLVSLERYDDQTSKVLDHQVATTYICFPL